MQEMQVRSLGWEDPLEEEMATHSSINCLRNPCTEEPDGLQSMELAESDMTSTLNKCPPALYSRGSHCWVRPRDASTWTSAAQDLRSASNPVLSLPAVGFLLAGGTYGQERKVGWDKRAGGEVYRERKGLRVNWFDLTILLNGSDGCQDQGSEWGIAACVCVHACVHRAVGSLWNT